MAGVPTVACLGATSPPARVQRERAAPQIQEAVFRHLISRWKGHWPGVRSYVLWVGAGYHDSAHEPDLALMRRLKSGGLPVKTIDGRGSEEEARVVSFGVQVADWLDPSLVAVRAFVDHCSRGSRFSEDRLLIVRQQGGRWKVTERGGTPAAEEALRETLFRYLFKSEELSSLTSDLSSTHGAGFASVVAGSPPRAQDPSPRLMGLLRSRYGLKPGSQNRRQGKYLTFSVGPVTWVDAGRALAKVEVLKADPSLATEYGGGALPRWAWLLAERKDGQWKVSGVRSGWVLGEQANACPGQHPAAQPPLNLGSPALAVSGSARGGEFLRWTAEAQGFNPERKIGRR